MVGNHLHWNNCQNSRQAIRNGGDANGFELGGDLIIARVAHNNWLTFAGGHLLEGAVHFLWVK